MLVFKVCMKIKVADLHVELQEVWLIESTSNGLRLWFQRILLCIAHIPEYGTTADCITESLFTATASKYQSFYLQNGRSND